MCQMSRDHRAELRPGSARPGTIAPGFSVYTFLKQFLRARKGITGSNCTATAPVERCGRLNIAPRIHCSLMQGRGSGWVDAGAAQMSARPKRVLPEQRARPAKAPRNGAA